MSKTYTVMFYNLWLLSKNSCLNSMEAIDEDAIESIPNEDYNFSKLEIVEENSKNQVPINF